jgi:hypothetical protein
VARSALAPRGCRSSQRLTRQLRLDYWLPGIPDTAGQDQLGSTHPAIGSRPASRRRPRHYIKTKSKSELGHEGHWLIDSIDPAGYTIVVGNVPAIPRFVLLHAFAGQYARACAARWGPTVTVKPLAA